MNNVLIVDDDDLIRYTFNRALMKEGFIISEAASGTEALGKIRGDVFAIAIIDVNLGDISGLDVIRQIKMVSPSTKIIVVTAMNEDHIREGVLREGVNGFYEKPFDTHEILDCIQGCLARYGKAEAREKRVSERFPFQKIIEFTLFDFDCYDVKARDQQGMVIDASHSGLSIKTDSALKPGSMIKFRDSVGTSEKAGVVRWSMMSDDMTFRAGVSFTEEPV